MSGIQQEIAVVGFVICGCLLWIAYQLGQIVFEIRELQKPEAESRTIEER